MFILRPALPRRRAYSVIVIVIVIAMSRVAPAHYARMEKVVSYEL